MIDWFDLAANALWISGCAMALAALSYANWEASIKKEKLCAQFQNRRIQIPLNLAGVLFCLGLAGTSELVWETTVWILLSVSFLVQVGILLYQRRIEKSKK